MLQAHSFLWHYLWVAPNVLLLALAVLCWKRAIHKQFPAFVAFAMLGSLGQLALYLADVSPSVSAENFWRVDWASLLTEGVLKFVLIAEIFGLAFGAYASIAQLGKLLIRAVGVVLVLAAAVAAAYAPKDNPNVLISGAHILDQTIFFIEVGLLVSLFLLSSYFHLSWNRPLFGVLFGLSISACVHLATWAVMANAGPSDATRYHLDFVNMATYHVCVLIWYYYLLVPEKSPTQPAVPPPQGRPSDGAYGGPSLEEVEAWNREVERLVHR